MLHDAAIWKELKELRHRVTQIENKLDGISLLRQNVKDLSNAVADLAKVIARTEKKTQDIYEKVKNLPQPV